MLELSAMDPRSSAISVVTRYAISVMCEDQVGLVARLTGAVSNLGGNMEELHQSVHLGYFVITLLATFPGDVTAGDARAALLAAGAPGEFVVSVLPRRERAIPPAVAGTAFVLTVIGEDSPGILTKVTTYLADRGINIEELQVLTAAGRFTITARLAIPDAADVRAVRLDLTEILSHNQATVSLLHEDIFAATNRIEMRRPG